MSELILALDFGGTKLTAAVTPIQDKRESPSRLNLKRLPSSPGADAQYDINTMLGLGQELLNGKIPAAVGVSFGGPVDFKKGTVRLSHHVPGWENVALQQLLEAEFSAPARVDNDANAAAIGEYHFGAGQGYSDLMYITVSTGVGGGWVLNGRPWRGYEGMAGEIGHTVVDPSGPLCLCGKRGCVERLASGPYMAQSWANMKGLSSPGTITGKMVADAAASGDVAAQKVLAKGAWALGVGIGNAANLINPQLFILGGGVTKSGDDWWAAVRQAAHQIALPEIHFEIVSAALADDAPLWGAVALAKMALQPAVDK